MKTTKIFLNDEFAFDLPKLLETRLLIQANSGAGKSYCIRKLLEETHDKVQQILIDLEGEFATLREKYDYLLVGKNGDTPATIKSAALLARKLMELRISAIIDISELHPTDRKRYVRLFLQSMIEAPKELWLTEHPALIVLDEAHHFAPEKGESEALDAVIDLMSRGRKRGLCGVLATQRISKLNKDAAAECNNKLIGRASQDIDMKRAAEELGFTSKPDMLSLRSLEPGEYYAFGAAMCNVPQKIKIGKVKTTHPKVGSRSIARIAPPRGAIKAVLGQLQDLPEEAEKEAKTMADLKAEVLSLKNANNTFARNAIKKPEAPPVVQKIQPTRQEIETMAKPHIMAVIDSYEKILSDWERYAYELKASIQNVIGDINQNIKEIKIPSKKPAKPNPIPVHIPYPAVGSRIVMEPRTVAVPKSILPGAREILNSSPEGTLPPGEQKVLLAIAQHDEGISPENISVLTGYKRSTRDRYVQLLGQKMFVMRRNNLIFATQPGVEALGNFEPLPKGAALIEHYMNTLPEGERRIFAHLVSAGAFGASREELSQVTGYQRSTRDRYLQLLQVRKLVEKTADGLKIAEKLLE